MSVNTQDMEIVHRAFRRESRLLIELIAAVAPGDTARAAVIAEHCRDYRLGLKNHHEGEDELLWPPLLARADPGADVILRMQAQHERVEATLTKLDAAVPAWETRAGADERDTLVAILVDHRAVLLEHLDDEEATLLPLAAEYITEREWASLGEHLVANTPKLTLLTLLGLVLEDADRAERAALLGALPTPIRAIWYVIGRLRYTRHIRRVRAARPRFGTRSSGGPARRGRR
ncbi:hemerythrin domain-containing protein [Nocardia veterana]|uniref:Hemerythrin domain-containing protein n=1 Tax=Nocardia veterana TaxID=132249 RepID=A0A7X6LY78_9NOCA|nr:hemerythrin domain-containing protein [Nocardia veterana]NKY86850.1 hemerythrin domain-containing protein [Nocardia veterana]